MKQKHLNENASKQKRQHCSQQQVGDEVEDRRDDTQDRGEVVAGQHSKES